MRVSGLKKEMIHAVCGSCVSRNSVEGVERATARQAQRHSSSRDSSSHDHQVSFTVFLDGTVLVHGTAVHGE